MNFSQERNWNMTLANLLRPLPRDAVALWALDCAEHVQDVYQREYPRDRRLRVALHTGRQYLQQKADRAALREAVLLVRDAARECDDAQAHLAAMAALLALRAVRAPHHALRCAAYALRARDSEDAYQLQRLQALAEKHRKAQEKR